MTARLLERQRKSFDGLVESGVYGADFDHPPAAKSFVASVLQEVVPRRPRCAPFAVLDCGCGTGAWLCFLHAEISLAGFTDPQLFGFDLSGRMVDIARQKLRGLATPGHLRTGNLLERPSYAFADAPAGFDLIFTYDVVQQLPRACQVEACRLLAAALAPGGLALVFDNDAASRFGRRMALRKFLTRYGGLRLVPRYYCNARYPPLEQIRQELERAPGLRARIVARADGIKRAMIVEREGAQADGWR